MLILGNCKKREDCNNGFSVRPDRSWFVFLHLSVT